MPDELIIDTFKYVHACIFNGPPETCSYGWMRLLNVCTRWRSIIRSVSHLWRIIIITPNPRRMNLRIQTSIHVVPSVIDVMQVVVRFADHYLNVHDHVTIDIHAQF